MRNVIFSDYGILISEYSGKYYLQTDSGEMVSRMIEAEVTKEDAERAQKSSQEAYEIIIKYDKKGAFKKV